MSENTPPINVVDIRRARNGWVVSCYFSERFPNRGEGPMVRGFVTYLVEGDDPKRIGDVVAQAFQDHPFTNDVELPPGRYVP